MRGPGYSNNIRKVLSERERDRDEGTGKDCITCLCLSVLEN
ncbi:unnamed protein product [Staurois parvus]|uniref:Uncharacterized protein n=1 Tax=Staurois parvus TaxID=386267 RepID=A0ABN9FKU5_9NEOB|nr:unnamed protein product [Staurois parvus]